MQRVYKLQTWKFLFFVLLYSFGIKIKLIKKYQLYAVSRKLQGRQRELVLRHSIPHYSPNFSTHCLLSGVTQRRAFALVPERRNENIKKIIIHSLEWDRTHNRRVTVTLLCRCATTILNNSLTITIITI